MTDKYAPILQKRAKVRSHPVVTLHDTDVIVNSLSRRKEVKPTYTCSSCDWSGEESRFITKVLSIMYRPRYDNIQAFKQIKCPKCNNLVTIIFETLDSSYTK